MSNKPATLMPEAIERILLQHLQTLYDSNLGLQFNNPSCQIFDDKIAIVLENSICRSIQLLSIQGKEKLAQKAQSRIEQVIEPQIKAAIEQVMEIPVVDLLINTSIKTGRTGIIAVLATAPDVCN